MDRFALWLTETAIGLLATVCIYKENVQTKQRVRLGEDLIPYNNHITLDHMHAMIWFRARILVQVTIYRRLLIGQDGHLDQSEAYDIS